MLTNLADFSDGATLVPESGIQFVEIGLDFDTSPRLSRKFIERRLPGQTDADGKPLVRLLTNWNDEDSESKAPYVAQGEDVEYEISKSLALSTFLDRWVPVPFYKIEPGRDMLGNEIYAHGPTDWVRVRVTETRNTYDDKRATHRAVFAFDTSLAPRKPNRAYLAPAPEDAMRAESFRFVSRLTEIVSFLSNRIEIPGQGESDTQLWVDDWLRDIFISVKKSQRRRTLTQDDFPYNFEHLARYIAFVQLLASMTKPLKATLIDTLSETKTVQPIDVDLVLDIGNSRSCGLLIQSFPDDQNVDLNNSLVLELRDLSRPEHVYRDPFESQCELIAAEFGSEDIARRSGRPKAFFWPSLLRIGPEASRLRGESEGNEAATGISSPKRYLWSSDAVLQDWKFRSASLGHSGAAPLIERSMYRFVNDRGDVIEQFESDRHKFKLKVRDTDLHTASRFAFSKSSFFTFMLVEIIAQAMSMMNNPGVRSERRHKDAPRRLRRIILTIPSATPVQEQRILRSRAEAAVKLLWSLAGWGGREGINKDRPEVHCSWDEASSVHLVYLYGEIIHKLGGSMRTLFGTLGKDRERPAYLPANKSKSKIKAERCLRIASVDVGGGTTDLMVTTYFQTDNVALYPDQNFREGFRIAGDDLLKTVTERLVIPRLEEMLAGAGFPNARNFLKGRFAGDNPSMSVQDKHLRRQFVLQVLQPIAIGILSECEAMPANSRQASIRKLSSFFESREGAAVEGDIPVDARILGYLRDKVVEAVGPDFVLGNCDITIDPVAVDECVLSTFDSVFDNIAEAINHLDVDVVLLTGRPMRLQQMVNLFINKLSVRTDCVIPIRDYRVGTWYPFRGVNNTHIEDPKTTAVVGAMLCALAERQITNFMLFSQYLRMKSTARYIGLLEAGAVLPDEKLLFSDVDLDGRSDSQEQEQEFDYFSPVRIGYRQLPLERWVATPLYKLVDGQPKPKDKIQRPIKVLIGRNTETADTEETDEDKLLSSELTREEFIIQEAEGLDGKNLKYLMEMKLDTLAIDTGDGYWLDTGILSIQ